MYYKRIVIKFFLSYCFDNMLLIFVVDFLIFMVFLLNMYLWVLISFDFSVKWYEKYKVKLLFNCFVKLVEIVLG